MSDFHVEIKYHFILKCFQRKVEKWEILFQGPSPISKKSANLTKHAVLRIRIRDPVPFWPRDPGSGMGKKQDPDPGSGSGMNIPDHISERLETIF